MADLLSRFDRCVEMGVGRDFLPDKARTSVGQNTASIGATAVGGQKDKGDIAELPTFGQDVRDTMTGIGQALELSR